MSAISMLDPDKAIKTIMLRRHSDGTTSATATTPSTTMQQDGTPDPRHEAAEGVLSAIAEKHAGKLLEALGKFHDLHAGMGPDADTEAAPAGPEGPETEE